MICKDCKYSQPTIYSDNAGNMLAACELTHHIVRAEMEHDCPCHNVDLSPYDICYNCKHYIGGGDWGLFCSHKDMYHHLGKFNDEPCRYYEKKAEGEE